MREAQESGGGDIMGKEALETEEALQKQGEVLSHEVPCINTYVTLTYHINGNIWYHCYKIICI